MKRRIGRVIDAVVGRNRSLVLLYHRVADVLTDPQLLAVSPRNFGEHLEIINRHYVARDLASVARRSPAAHRGTPIAVTFDDGYADNLHVALPLLRAATVPATIFVVTGHVGVTEEFWWDDVERILLMTATLPSTLDLTIASNNWRWTLGTDPDASDLSWNVLSARSPSARQAVYQQVCDLIRPLAPAERKSVLQQLRAWAGVGAAGRAENRALSVEELRALARDDLVSIGAHSMTHSLLAARPIVEQEREIGSSKQTLERILNVPVESFAYPFGGQGQYTNATTGIVKRAGFRYACANVPGPVRWSSPRYEIPRFLVRNWTGAEFAERLKAFSGG